MRDLQIIGDRIEFMGYHVGTLSDIVPNTIRARFEDCISRASMNISNPLAFNRSHQIVPKKGKRK